MNLSKILIKTMLGIGFIIQNTCPVNCEEGKQSDKSEPLKTDDSKIHNITNNADYLQLIDKGYYIEELKTPRSSAEDKNISIIICDSKEENFQITYFYNDRKKYKENVSKTINKKFFDKGFFERFTNLNALILNNITMDSKFAIELEESGLNQRDLKNIVINNCVIVKNDGEHVEDELITALVKPVKEDTKPIGLESLSFGFLNSEYFPEKLFNLLANENQLKHLWCAIPSMKKNVGELIGKLISNNPSLATLSINAVDIEPNSFTAIAKNIGILKKLDTLELYFKKLNKDSYLNFCELIDNLYKNDNIKLTLQTFRCNLDLSNFGTRNYESIEKIAKLLSSFHNLMNLNLSGFKASDRGIERLFQEALLNKTQLRLLVLDQINLSLDTSNLIGNSILNMPNLVNLSMNNCQLDDLKISKIIPAISSEILKRIYLDGNDINNIDLGKIISKKDIEYISLQKNHITSQNAEKIFQSALLVNRKNNALIINCNDNDIFKNDSNFYNKYNIMLLNLLLNGKKQHTFLLAN